MCSITYCVWGVHLSTGPCHTLPVDTETPQQPHTLAGKGPEGGPGETPAGGAAALHALG